MALQGHLESMALGIGDGATWHSILQVGGYLIKKMTKVQLRGYPAHLLPSEHRLVERHVDRQESEYTMFDLEDCHFGTALQGTRKDKGISVWVFYSSTS